jgi:hypothetical protein
MKNRKNKRRLYQLWFQDSQRLRLTEEDHAWLNMPSIGREFGSPDFDRLMKLDALPDPIKTSLLNQVRSMVEQSGTLDNFDEEIWLARWLFEPLPALGGKCPSDFLENVEKQKVVVNILAAMQSGAFV